jgi:alpha-2-macroglobulin
LALGKSPENAAMNALREKPNLSVAARWRLAAAYAVAGKREIAQQLTQSISTAPVRYRELSYTFGSDLRDQAMILETLVLSQNANQAVQVAREVAQKLSSGDWYGTQSVAFGLLSMAKFVSLALITILMENPAHSKAVRRLLKSSCQATAITKLACQIPVKPPFLPV